MPTYGKYDRNSLISLAERRGIPGASKIEEAELIDALKLEDRESHRFVLLTVLLALSLFGWALVAVASGSDQVWIVAGIMVVVNMALGIYESSVTDTIKKIRIRHKPYRAN